MAAIGNSNPAPSDGQNNPFVLKRLGVTIDQSIWYCDAYSGSAEALIAAGLVTADQLEPQKGRKKFVSAFYGDGTPVPPGASCFWGTPGRKVILDLGEKRYRVEVTATKDEMKRRHLALDAKRKLERRKEYLAEAEKRAMEPLTHGFGDDSEYWHGTKEQLQEQGLGVDCVFPGEPGGEKLLLVDHPLGFKVEIKIDWQSQELGPGHRLRYTAHSWYVTRDDHRPERKELHAPGVTRIISWWNIWNDCFVGTADALVSCGLARMDQFPGQPGRGSVQCSYQIDDTRATNSSKRNSSMTIRRQGKHRFSIEKSISVEEEQKRKKERKDIEDRQKEETRAARELRMRLHAVDSGPATFEDFRKQKAKSAESVIDLVWSLVFASPEGQFKFKIDEDDDVYDELAEAFDTIREAVQDARIVRDSKVLKMIEGGKKMVAAKADAPLQNFLRLVVTKPLDE